MALAAIRPEHVIMAAVMRQRKASLPALPWREWLDAHFASYTTAPFAERHERYWEWLTALEPDVRPRPRVEVYPRGGGKSTTIELGCAYLGSQPQPVRHYVLYVCKNQAQANKHVQSIAAMMERVGVTRAINQYGSSKGWRHEEIRTANGFNVTAFGLDSGMRGVKLDEYRPDIIICHKIGTPVCVDGQWMNVEDYPGARSRESNGLTVSLWGLPFTETVTPEHRYWVRCIEPIPGTNRYSITDDDWREAQHLDKHSYIGMPVDMAEQAPEPIPVYRPGVITERDVLGRVVRAGGEHTTYIPDQFHDPEWWWLFGLWWGDGHTNARQIGLTVANTMPDTLARITHLLDRDDISYTIVPKTGCSQVIFTHTAFAKWLKTWRSGNSRKQPPLWVERLPLRCQHELVRGYVEADGHVAKNGVRVTSIHIDGLLSLRRILLRFGIAATIRKGAAPRREVFPNGVASMSSQKYDLHFSDGADAIGYNVQLAGRYAFKRTFVADGHLWCKVRGIEPIERETFVPITTPTHDYLTHFGRSHNCDDIDDRLDTPETVQKKIDVLTTTILPSGSSACAVIVVQNKVHEDSIVSRLCDGRADFLHDRLPPTVEPAVRDLEVERQIDDVGMPRYVITGGTPSWEGQSLATCEQQINSWGLTAFLREAQHEVDVQEGGLWDRGRDIDPFRDTAPPILDRVVVAIDPSATTGGDEAGIVVGGMSRYWRGRFQIEPHAYILDDRSLQGPPKVWAEAAVAAYHAFRADAMVAESNNGGEMVAVTIGTIPGAPHVTLIHASRGKLTRAEPVQKLYGDGRVHHVGTFPKLESEMCTWQPGMASPNRVDALVFCLSELMLDMQGGSMVSYSYIEGADDEDNV